MERSKTWPVPFADIGSILATVATLLRYIQSNQTGQPGGYLPMVFGALAVGVLVIGCSYYAKPQSARSGSTAVLLGALASVAFVGSLFATVIWGFGS